MEVIYQSFSWMQDAISDGFGYARRWAAQNGRNSAFFSHLWPFWLQKKTRKTINSAWGKLKYKATHLLWNNGCDNLTSFFEFYFHSKSLFVTKLFMNIKLFFLIPQFNEFIRFVFTRQKRARAIKSWKHTVCPLFARITENCARAKKILKKKSWKRMVCCCWEMYFYLLELLIGKLLLIHLLKFWVQYVYFLLYV